jgi:hypothetical protein
MGREEGVGMAVDDTNRRNEAGRADAPAKDQELAEVCARFADLCQYFSQQIMDLPANIVDEVRSAAKLTLEDRVARMKRLNQELMEYLHVAGPGPQIRQ